MKRDDDPPSRSEGQQTMKRDDGPPTGSEKVGQTCSQQRFSSHKETGGGLTGIGNRSSITVPTNQQWIKGGGALIGYLQYLQYSRQEEV
jgi:hypothetical protein